MLRINKYHNYYLLGGEICFRMHLFLTNTYTEIKLFNVRYYQKHLRSLNNYIFNTADCSSKLKLFFKEVMLKEGKVKSKNTVGSGKKMCQTKMEMK